MDNKRRLQIASAANPSLRVAVAPQSQLPTISVQQPTVQPQLTIAQPGANQQHLFVGGKEVFADPNAQTQPDQPVQSQAHQSLLQRIGGLGKAIGVGLIKAPVQFVNQAYGEAREAYDTEGAMAGNLVRKVDPNAGIAISDFANKDYNNTVNNDFGDHAGLFGLGTFTNSKETRQGAFVPAVRKIGAGTAETALSILPFAKGAGLGLDAAQASIDAADAADATNAAVQGSRGAQLAITGAKAAGEGALYGTGNAAAQEVSNGKFNAKQLAEGAGQGALFGLGGAAAGYGAGKVISKVKGALTNNPTNLDLGTIRYLENEKDPEAVHSVLSSLAGGTSPELEAASQKIAASGSRKEIINTLLDLPQEAAGGTVAAAVAEDALKGSKDKSNTEDNAQPQTDATPQTITGADGSQIDVNTGLPIVELDTGNSANGSVPDGTPGSVPEPDSNFVPSDGTTAPATAADANATPTDTTTTPSITDLSRLAKNSFENDPTAAKPGGMERAAGEIDNGSARPIRYRTLDDGSTVIEDGRHRLEAARQAGIDDFPVQDVTGQYSAPSINDASVQDALAAIASGKPATAEDLQAVNEALQGASDTPPTDPTAANTENMSPAEQQTAADAVNKNITEAKGAVSDFVGEYADLLKSIEDHATGGQKVPDGEGGYVRTSEHSQFYRQYFAANGRAPTLQAYADEAERQLEAGQGDSYAVQEYNMLKQNYSDAVDHAQSMDFLAQNPEYPTDLQLYKPKSQDEINQGSIPRGVTSGVKGSAEYSPEVKAGVNATRGVRAQSGLVDNGEQLLSTGIDNAADVVRESLSKPNNAFSDQDVANVGATVRQLQLSGRMSEAADILNQTGEKLTEAGRTVAAARLLYNSTPEGVIFQAQRDLSKANVPIDDEVAGQLSAALDYLKSTPEGSMERQIAIQQVSQYVKEQSPSSFGDKAFALWRAGLLTGTQTIGKVGVSHIIQSAVEKAKDIPAVAVDKFVSMFTGQRAKTLTARGNITGAKNGLNSALTYMKTGIETDPLADTAEVQNSVIFGKSVPGQIAQKYADTIGRIHGSLYKPFYGAAQLNSLYDQAGALAKNAGLSGDEAQYFIEQHVANPTPSMLETSAHDAQMATFQQQTKLGSIASQIQQKGGIFGKVIAPFTRIPSAIATDLISYSPAGAVGTIIKGIKSVKDGGWDVAAQRDFANGLGRSITGSAAIIPGLALYGAGVMTLGYPTDPKEQKLWQEEGKQENSVLINGKWRSLGSLGPLGSVLEIGGYIGQSMKGGKDVGGAIVDGFAGGLKSIEDQSYLSGVNNAINAIEEPGQYASNFVKSTASSIIPTIAGTIANATDSVQRQTGKGIISGAEDAIKAKIPGLRETLPVKNDALGAPLPGEETGWQKIVDPFQSSTARPGSPIVTELQRLQDSTNGVQPTTIEKTTSLDGVQTPLSQKQQSDLQTSISKDVTAKWQQMIADPQYAQLNDQQKAAALTSAADDITTAKKQTFAAENQLGQYAPGYTGKGAKLTANQQQIMQGGNVDYLTDAVNKANNGTDDPAIAKTDGATKTYYNTVRGMNSQQLASYLASPADDNAKAIANQINSDLPNGLKVTPSNKIAQDYAAYQKAKAGGNWDKITSQEKSDTLHATVVKDNKPQLTQDLYDAGSSHVQTYLNEGYVTKPDLDDAIDLDNQLYSSGLESSLKFGKTFRKTYGYGLPPDPTSDTSKSSVSSSSKDAGAKEVKTGVSNIKLHFTPGSSGGQSSVGSADTTIAAPKQKITYSAPGGKTSKATAIKIAL